MNEEPEFTIIQDTREQTPWIFDYEKTIAQEIGTLKTGDYTLKGFEDKLCIERKGCIEELIKIMVEHDVEEARLQRSSLQTI